MRLGLLSGLYIAGLAGLQLFYSVVHPLRFEDRLPFLPLMAVSVYCSVGVLWALARVYVLASRVHTRQQIQ